jgi:transposase InsO family protein
MRRLAAKHPRFGYRRIWRMLREEGWRVNAKRVQRLWRREGMKVPQKRRKRRARGSSANSCAIRKAEHPNHVLSYDFVSVVTVTGRRIRILAVTDEFTKECLALHAASSITSEDVIGVLAPIMMERGVPRMTRSDNGPEFVAKAVTEWLQLIDTEASFIAPGSPWENGVIESFNSKLRDELLDLEEIQDLQHLRYLLREFQIYYNTIRPHSSIGYQTPEGFAASCSPSGSASLRLRENSSSNTNPLTLFHQPQLS